MKNQFRHSVWLLLIALPGFLVHAVEPDGAKTSSLSRKEKIRIILRLQDQRSTGSDTLISFFHDPDPLIRARAALSCGSLQDTSLLPPLVELFGDRDNQVELSAAFAVGQTAGFLSETSKKSLQGDLLEYRLERMSSERTGGRNPLDCCIEEIGKFGDVQALRELVERYGTGGSGIHRRALTMSIARFAIRGIRDSVADQFLIRYLGEGRRAPWQVAYALQRIGGGKELRDHLRTLVASRSHSDPLFRMNIAALLGKLGDSATSLKPLMDLAGHDPDWRVRVNALKALSTFDLNTNAELVDLYGRMIPDSNQNVGLTAISSLGSSNLKGDVLEHSAGTYALLQDIAANRNGTYPGEFQGEAALTLSRIIGARALGFIRIADTTDRIIRGEFIHAIGSTGDVSAARILLGLAGGKDPSDARAALEGMDELVKRKPSDRSLTDSMYGCLISALSSPDVALRATAASLLGDSLFRRSTSVPSLIDALQRARIPDDIEAIQEIAATLGKLGDTLALRPLKALLQMKDRSVIRAAAAALRGITKRDDYADERVAFAPSYADYDFNYLDALPSVIRVKMGTSRGEIIMDLDKDMAPFSVMSFLKLATRRRLYNGTIFHRVVPNFVIQGGDPRGDGWGGPGYTLRSEFSPLRYETGSVGIASAGKDTEGSQFFITQSPQPHLDGRYTIIGRVVAGMDVVSRIMIGDTVGTISILP